MKNIIPDRLAIVFSDLSTKTSETKNEYAYFSESKSSSEDLFQKSKKIKDKDSFFNKGNSLKPEIYEAENNRIKKI